MNVEELDPNEVLDGLMGRSMVSWGRDETMYHINLDDGRVLVFMYLGVVTYPANGNVH